MAHQRQARRSYPIHTERLAGGAPPSVRSCWPPAVGPALAPSSATLPRPGVAPPSCAPGSRASGEGRAEGRCPGPPAPARPSRLPRAAPALAVASSRQSRWSLSSTFPPPLRGALPVPFPFESPPTRLSTSKQTEVAQVSVN